MNGTIALHFEVMLVDPRTGARRPEASSLLSILAPSQAIDPGLTHSTVRLTTPACHSIEQLEDELESQLGQLERAARMLGVEPVLAAVHPTAPAEAPWWPASVVDGASTPGQRWIQQRVMTSGVTIMVRPLAFDAWSPGGLAVELPMLLALSASSPFWEGQHTGFASTRAAVLYGSRLGEAAFEWVEPVAGLETPRLVTERSLSHMVTVRRGRGLDLHVADVPSRPRDLLALALLGRLMVERPLGVAVSEDTLERNLWRGARAGHRASFEVPGKGSLVSLPAWVAERAETGLLSPWRERLLALAQTGAASPRLVHAWRHGVDAHGLVQLMRRDWSPETSG